MDTNEITCNRGQKKSLDHILSTGKAIGRTVTKEIQTSDHKMVINRIKLEQKIIRREKKEFVFSNLINKPKLKHLQAYLEYNIKHWELVCKGKMNTKNFRNINEEILRKVPVIAENDAAESYEIEHQIQVLIEKGSDMKRLQYEVSKLRKYNYDMYIQNNVSILKKNPRKYHQCLQNIIN